MTTPEAKFALFSAQSPSPGKREPQEGWKLLGNDLHTKAASISGVLILGEGSALLPLPNALPTLCRCVATSQEFELQYTVWLFSQPLLSYPTAADHKEE